MAGGSTLGEDFPVLGISLLAEMGELSLGVGFVVDLGLFALMEREESFDLGGFTIIGASLFTEREESLGLAEGFASPFGGTMRGRVRTL
jgi:hypothetical protein